MQVKETSLRDKARGNEVKRTYTIGAPEGEIWRQGWAVYGSRIGDGSE